MKGVACHKMTISQFHNHASEGTYCLKRIIIDIFILYLKKYFHSFIQSAVFTGRVAHQNNGLYVLRMIVKLASMN